MDINKGPLPSTEALERLYDFIQEPEEDVRSIPIDVVKKELEARRCDVTPVLELVQKRLIEERLRIAREKREKIDALKKKLASFGDDKRRLQERLQDILRDKPQFAVAYRNLETLSDGDLESLLDDFQIMELFDGPDVSRQA